MIKIRTRIKRDGGIPPSLRINLNIYDLLGNKVSTLVDENKPAGAYEVEWNAEGLSSGIYFYQLKSGNFLTTKKMILLR